MTLDYNPQSDRFDRLSTQARFRPQPIGRPASIGQTYYQEGLPSATPLPPGMTIGTPMAPQIGQFLGQDADYFESDVPVGPGGPINIDPTAFLPAYEEFQDYHEDQLNQGLGYAPTALPVMSFNNQRDLETGDYLGYDLEANWSGVPGAVRTLGQQYMDVQRGRWNATVEETNRDRRAVQLAAQPIEYTAPRTVEIFNPVTGIPSFRTVNDRLFAPFLNPAAQYV